MAWSFSTEYPFPLFIRSITFLFCLDNVSNEERPFKGGQCWHLGKLLLVLIFYTSDMDEWIHPVVVLLYKSDFEHRSFDTLPSTFMEYRLVIGLK
jgi:hypothetical protein